MIRERVVTLRGMLLVFVLLTTLATLCNSLFVAYQVQRDALIHSAREANSAYAAKVASSIGEFLNSAHRHLSYSTAILSRHMNDPQVIRAEAVRLQAQDAYFNSIAIVDATGKVLQAYPDALQIVGTTLRSEGILQALKERRPLVSQAYESVAGNLVVFISQPIVSPSGEFLGVVGGSVYIVKQSMLHTIISSHFHRDGTFAFVADANRRLLYHPNQSRLGELLGRSATVDAALRGESGAQEIVNYRGIPMLAGYAPVADANWAVVAQQPRELTLVTLRELMTSMLIGIIPASLVGLVLIWAGAALISHPLQQLAKGADKLSAPETTAKLREVKTWYAEAAAIRQALLTGVQLLQQKLGRLSHEAQSDPLTGLANRRAMDSALEVLTRANLHYSVLALDIDYFKRVNDTYGHDAGDEALKRVAAILRQYSRGEDLACRSGGEEFVLLLPDTPLETARGIAERIRGAVEAAEVPRVGHLTISIGAASGVGEPEAILKAADECLYRAKQSGRNRVVAG
ncbi:sensor domain-containing diguanylate cyclase [Pseudomonas sp. ZM23]|uniref:diguanylate cyclase n=1 Tax=Pseudomonas triclosanedens TaxID=2961893 RepID=A0ABY6ZSB8_9PSED|nr:sensor domain-containing diguanylate cyclase [Pseudomonas triclosanedens]MCP8466996.1 sensor domain-containing diguanylate cyclase [Pseudomonas triclosanedens]MCP8472856.1 sensor domain-containing diguanylate cyclase [Pseudomonas triclosanedens]MCP8478287.1 sensor domain-containing diguanylate cyclase [Pseudomonas triclosanedens]WAI47691.1 sensor domain-containing diguanylate cyclase [Pseudomonas triclosanedens]